MTPLDKRLEDLEDLYENAPCGYLSMLPTGRIVKVNRTLLQWTGYASDEMIGKPFRDFLPVAGRMFYETHFAPLLRLQGYFNEVALDIVKQDGGRIPVLANALERRDGDGELLFTRLTVFPASDRRRFERGLLSAQAASDEKIRGLEEASEFREQFVAVLGHDLRNPLASIASGVRMLERDADGRNAKILELMNGSIARMSGLIDNVMDFARGRLGGGIGVALVETDGLETVLRQVAEEIRSANPDREIETEIRTLGTIRCDAARIGQMVSNLLSNALAHGSRDGPVTLSASKIDGQLDIFVANEGNPIAPEKLVKLFQPFFRGENSGTRDGLGLGLHIASEIAKAHNGTLVAISGPDETRFTFSMAALPPT